MPNLHVTPCISVKYIISAGDNKLKIDMLKNRMNNGLFQEPFYDPLFNWDSNKLHKSVLDYQSLRFLTQREYFSVLR